MFVLKILRTVTILVSLILLMSCSTVKFNKKYLQDNWSIIIIAPLTDDTYSYVTDQFIHEFATSSSVKFITPGQISTELARLDLVDAYNLEPLATLNILASDLNANGFLVTDVKANSSQSSNVNYVSEASIRTTLYAYSSLDIVSSTFHEHKSFFFGQQYSISKTLSNTIDELKDVFKKLNSKFEI